MNEEKSNPRRRRGPFARTLRVSVTDRCNFRCAYCTPAESYRHVPHDRILRYEEILRIVRVAARAGVRKVRLTGGEPLVRKNLPRLVKRLASIEGIRELCLTTNGSLLPRFARPLKEAGLDRVTVSLDSLRPDRFERITGGGDLTKVLSGIDAALAENLTPLKVNAVLLRGVNIDEVSDFIALAQRLSIEVRFIEYMPMGKEAWEERFLSAEAVEAIVREALPEPPSIVEEEGPVARILRLPGGGRIGLIAPMTNPFCGSCDRLRLSSGGLARACLIRGGEVDLREALRNGASDEGILARLEQAWTLKPDEHGLEPGVENPVRGECQGMLGIGG
ncbi:MAG: GTP 3',8-cyclase MoaA [Planctomycetota bacterium]